MTGLASGPAPAIRSQVVLVVGDAGARAAEGERRPEDQGVAEHAPPAAAGTRTSLWRCGFSGTSAPEAGDDLLEPLPVLARHDRVDVGADQFHPVPGQRARLVQGPRRRSARSGRPGWASTASGRSSGDHLLQDILGDRLHVGGVGELGIGHDRRWVGVDQADPDAFLAEHPAGLGAGVVELASLADDDRPGPMTSTDLMSSRLGVRAPPGPLRAQNSSKRPTASCGPGAASGWYWTLKAGVSSRRRPSTTPSRSG